MQKSWTMSSVTQTEERGGNRSSLVWAIGTLLLLGGFLAVFQVYRWHFTAPVIFLCLAWASILITALTLAGAGLSAADDTGVISDVEFWKPVGERSELEREKRALLKAIKEIEFDREMGKMSDDDARELTHSYRQHAIELIKALESKGDVGELSVSERIEREVQARVAVNRTKAKGARKGRAGKAKAAEHASKDAADADAASENDDATRGEAIDEHGESHDEAEREVATERSVRASGAEESS